MAIPLLGSAAVTVSISDADGFQVIHSDGSLLAAIPPEHLDKGDWDLFWNGIEAVKRASAERVRDAAVAAG